MSATETAAPDEQRVQAIASAIDAEIVLLAMRGSAASSREVAKLLIAADPATQIIRDLEAKIAALTTVAEDAKALAKQPMGLRLNAREFATLLASLRSWQMELSELSSNELAEMNTDIHFSGIEGGPLSSDEIDNLCERLNCGAAL